MSFEVVIRGYQKGRIYDATATELPGWNPHASRDPRYDWSAIRERFFGEWPAVDTLRVFAAKTNRLLATLRKDPT